jgi:hypothetical protein
MNMNPSIDKTLDCVEDYWCLDTYMIDEHEP